MKSINVYFIADTDGMLIHYVQGTVFKGEASWERLMHAATHFRTKREADAFIKDKYLTGVKTVRYIITPHKVAKIGKSRHAVR